jgi:hypothetical protein
VDRMQVTPDMDPRLAVVNTVMNFQIYKTAGNVMNSRVTDYQLVKKDSAPWS